MNPGNEAPHVVKVEGLMAEANGQGRLLCRARRLWRPRETFGGTIVGAAFKDDELLEDPDTIDIKVAEVCSNARGRTHHAVHGARCASARLREEPRWWVALCCWEGGSGTPSLLLPAVKPAHVPTYEPSRTTRPFPLRLPHAAEGASGH